MGWDKKQRGLPKGYYYQASRVNGRVVKKYVGSGPLAELVALHDVRKRAAGRAVQAAARTERSRLQAVDRETDGACRLGVVLTRALLILNGFYCHHGEWRKRTGSRP